MSFFHRVLRALMHFNIGATLGVSTWLIWASAGIASQPPTSPAPSASNFGASAESCGCRALEQADDARQRGFVRIAGAAQ